MTNSQSGLFRGIYQFEDPSGNLIAAKVPTSGSVDLYDGTSVIVRPNQCAIFVYQGKIADILPAGAHTLRTGNLPILTRLAHWRFGMESPLQCELWFFSGSQFSALRWGTGSPVLHSFEGVGSIALRAFGNYNIVVTNPSLLYSTLIGVKTFFHIDEIKEFVRGQIAEVFPKAIEAVGLKKLDQLGNSQSLVALQIEKMLQAKLKDFGLSVSSVQVLSILPPDEIMKALDEKAAMNVLGDSKAYLLYKAATSLEGGSQSSGQDPLHMMMGLMLGRGVFEAAPTPQAINAQKACSNCGTKADYSFSFCPKCGSKI